MIRSILLVAPVLILGTLDSPTDAQSRPIGWTYTVNNTTDSGDAARRTSMAIRQQVLDNKIRMEFVQISNLAEAGSAEGMFQIMNSSDSTMTMVMPAQRMATVMNVGGMLTGRDLTPKIATHMTKSQVEDLGAGEKILGHATRHMRVTSEGTIDVTFHGQSCTGSANSVAEMWIAPDVDMRGATEATAKVLTGAFGANDIAPGTTSGAQPLPSGTTLRSISKSTRVNAKGQPITVTTTMEFVELAHGPVDPSLFVVPSEYHLMDMRKMMAEMPAGTLDSAANAGMELGAAASLKAMCHTVGSP